MKCVQLIVITSSKWESFPDLPNIGMNLQQSPDVI